MGLIPQNSPELYFSMLLFFFKVQEKSAWQSMGGAIEHYNLMHLQYNITVVIQSNIIAILMAELPLNTTFYICQLLLDVYVVTVNH